MEEFAQREELALSDESATPSGVTEVAHGDENEVENSDVAKARPPESQFDVHHFAVVLFLERYFKMEKQLHDKEILITQQQTKIDELQTEIRNLRTENEIDKLQTKMRNLRTENEIVELQTEIRNLRTENEILTENIDGDPVHYWTNCVFAFSENSKNYNQVEPPELAGFFDSCTCPVSCGLSVVLFILYMMELRLCPQRFMIYLRSKIPRATPEVGKCSMFLTDCSEAGLLEEKDVFNKAITGACTINNALGEVRRELKDQTDPAVLAIEYKKRPDGKQAVGHCVARMPDNKYIDVTERQYWTPTPDISHIHVVNVNKSNFSDWKHHCEIRICEDECTVAPPNVQVTLRLDELPPSEDL